MHFHLMPPFVARSFVGSIVASLPNLLPVISCAIPPEHTPCIVCVTPDTKASCLTIYSLPSMPIHLQYVRCLF